MGPMTAMSAGIGQEQWARREEVRREEDGELLGFMVPTADDAWLPAAVFGSPLGTPTSRDAAGSVLDRLGLEPLADPWLMDREEPGAVPLQVRVVEADPTQVTVRNADYGSGLDLGMCWTLPAPAHALRWIP